MSFDSELQTVAWQLVALKLAIYTNIYFDRVDEGYFFNIKKNKPEIQKDWEENKFKCVLFVLFEKPLIGLGM